MQYISVAAIIIADLGVILGAVFAVSKAFGKFRNEMHGKIEKVMEGMMCQHRSEMLRIYYHNVDDKQIRQYEFENFLMHYASYKALGGNSFIDKINDEVSKWTIIT